MATLLNMNLNSNHRSNQMKCYQLNIANIPDSQAGLEPVQQSRCYLCDIPKQDYSLTKSFSELICRGCLNYEGPDRIEQLIAEAYQIKKRQASPAFSATPQLVGNGNNIHKTQTTRFGNGSNSGSELAHLRDVQSFAHNQPAKQITLPPMDSNLAAHCVTNGLEVGMRTAASDGLIPSTAANRAGKERCLQKSERSLSGSPTHSIVWDNQIVAPESQGRLSARTSLPSTTCETRPTIAPTATPSLKSLRFKPGTATDCVAGGNQIKNQTSKSSRFLDQSKQNERYAFDASAQVGSNQESSNKQLGPRTSSPSKPLESSSLSQTLIEKTLHSAKGPNERGEAENYMSKEKVGQTKQSPPGSMNYALQQQQQQQQMLAAYDPMHMVRTPACGAVDHLMRLNQQHFPALSNTNLERELARLQGGPSVGDGARRASQLATLPDCSRTSDSLQRFIQDPNTALSLPFYAASSMSCGGAAYFVQPPPPPPPPPSQQQSIHSTAGSLGSDAMNRVKQTTPAPPSSLYDAAPYSYAMAPYLASNGALFCPPQYHPYHYHPHPTTFQSAAYGNILSSAGCMTTSQCFTPQASGFNGLVGSLEKSSSCVGGPLATASGGSKLERRLLGVPDSSPHKSNGAEPQCVGQLSAKEKQTTRKSVASPERTIHRSNENEGDQSLGLEVVDGQRKRDRNSDTVKESESSRTSNTLIILERDRESLASDDGDQQQDQQQVQTARDKQSTSMLNGTGSTNPSPTKSRSDLHYRLSTSNSPPPTKRPAIGFSRTSKSSAKGDLGNGLGAGHTPPPVPPQPLVPSPHSFNSSGNLSKSKPQTSASKQQPMTRRSQAPASSERSSATDMTNKMKHNNVPAAGQDGDGLRQLRKAIDGDSFPRANHELVARSGPIHNTNSASNTTNSSNFHNENSSDRNFGSLSSEPATPVSISSTTGLANRAPPSGQDPKQGQQAQQAQQQMQTPPHKYSPLKCLSCQERLEDRHFVQCPSVMAHKFCFACSKKSIERQQSENKNLGGGFERVFCPSGRRCFLATEQTPWTFMNSEIETIFRESSRVSSSSSGSSSVAPAEAPNSRVNSSASSSPIKSKHNQTRAGDEFEVCDKVQRSSSRLPPAAQSKHDETTDSSSQKVGSMSTQKANKVN